MTCRYCGGKGYIQDGTRKYHCNACDGVTEEERGAYFG